MKCQTPNVIYPFRSIDWVDKNGDEKPMSVPCGKCIPCLMNKRNEWSFRLEQEYKYSKSAHFVTLTYDQKHIRSDNSLNKRDLQLFFKRLRKKYEAGRIRYYAVGEYGTKTGRPHYHILLFNADEAQIRDSWRDSKGNSIGIVHIGRVTSASVAYVTKYIVQPLEPTDGRERPFSTMSRAYGIGGRYLSDEMVEWHRSGDKNYAIREGAKVRLPKFYKNKIWYKTEDRERITSNSMQLILQAQIKEEQYWKKAHGERWKEQRAYAMSEFLSRVKTKVSFTQKF